MLRWDYDPGSRKVWVYFLKNKSKVFNTFKKWKAAVENETNHRVKCLKSDNGGEYSSREFIEYCAENGIRMLKHPTRQKHLNRMKEEWQGKEVSPAHLKVKDVARDRLDAKSMKCTFIGYGSDEMEIDIWDFETHKKKAIIEEIVSLEKNQTWSLVRLPAGKKALQSKWVFRGVDYYEIFSPVMKMTTIRLVLSIVAAENLHLEQLDVKTAFLHGHLDEDIYMTQPEGFQSAGQEENLRAGYKRCAIDHCCYLKKVDSYSIILLLYVDDMLVAGFDMAEIKKLKRQLSQEFEMKDLGKVLEKFNMKDAKARCQPLGDQFKLIGNVMHAMVCTRPYIAHTVGVASRFMFNPRKEHWEAVKWLLRYLKGTSKATLCFSIKEVVLEGFSDSDYGGCLDSGKSTTGYVFTVGRTTILGAKNRADMLTKLVTTEKFEASRNFHQPIEITEERRVEESYPERVIPIPEVRAVGTLLFPVLIDVRFMILISERSPAPVFGSAACFCMFRRYKKVRVVALLIGRCDNHDLSRKNQSIERDRLIGIGFVLDFVEFISFTLGDKEMILVTDTFGLVLKTVVVVNDSSEANGIIRGSQVGINGEFCEMVMPARVPKELVGFTPRRRIGFRMELVQGATPICEGSCRLTSLERQKRSGNDCRVSKVRVGRMITLLCGSVCILGRRKCGSFGMCIDYLKKRCVMDTLKFTAMPFGLTNAPAVFMELMSRGGCTSSHGDDDRGCGVTEGREDVREVFQQRGSGAKRKLSRCGRNQIGNEPILALPEGADDFVVYYDARSKDLEACLEKGEDKVRTSIWRDVRTLAIEEAYTTKYSIHPGADTMLCGFRLTNRWLSMKKDIASCGRPSLKRMSEWSIWYKNQQQDSGNTGRLEAAKLSKVLAWSHLGDGVVCFERKTMLGNPSYVVGNFEDLWIDWDTFLFDELRVLMPRVVKSRDEIFSRWGYCDNHDLSRLDNQSIERDRLIGIGFVLNFVKFISFTFGDKEMISVIEAIIREVFVKLLLDSFGKLSISHECVDKGPYSDELEQVHKEILEIQEGLKARIKILEKAVQRCEK
ncbi:retrovirus-related pol polyprotein from transposon TNT 1-94 [Tanacetum coccineum]|uniref:Retrovirus-related pol polyprotein from transposon TNT 1-94 n=1 Tax=Tanacetum coccineum TaxID=301880 RepID=A0ABQ4XGC3_9ASTR